MKSLVLFTALSLSLAQFPAVLTKRVKVPSPAVHTFNKKAGKFLKYM